MSIASSCFARVPAFWLANVPGVAGINHMVSYLCAPLVTALCFQDVLIFGNDDFQCLRVSETHVWCGISYLNYQSFSDLLLPSWLMRIVTDNSGPLSVSPCPIMELSPRTWSRLVTFRMQNGTLGLARTRVLATNTPSRELFCLVSVRTLATLRGVSNVTITTFLHRAGITSLQTGECREDVNWAPGLHSVTFS
jgi:hypothetical protein